ncbi:hypothetical protein SEA_PUPPER_75 [Gordonia phage Pupper]|uniref:Uncharacterized protein n=1 Tax=Gordonia phage Pupper TaxID=2571249 RepID=A0A4Y6EMC5_9CAUD|nr:hypothetical protein KHQ83_gp202 [Gordonia phage Pupper]QDF18561.1 hypothetical protein SEA_PUPPER_75 [Gordonia phage Pupper]
MENNENTPEVKKPDLESIGLRARNTNASNRWMEQLLTVDIPAMIDYIHELERQIAAPQGGD